MCIWRKKNCQKGSNYNETLKYNWMWKTWIQINKNQGWKKIHYKTRKTFPKVVYMDNYTKLLWVLTLLFVIFTYTVSPLFKLLGQYERIDEKLWKRIWTFSQVTEQPRGPSKAFWTTIHLTKFGEKVSTI